MTLSSFLLLAGVLGYWYLLSRMRRERDKWKARALKAETFIKGAEQNELIRFDLKINGEVVRSYFFNGYRLQFIGDENGHAPPGDMSATFGGVFSWDQRIEGP